MTLNYLLVLLLGPPGEWEGCRWAWLHLTLNSQAGWGMGWGWAGYLALLIMQENGKAWVFQVLPWARQVVSLFGFPTGVILAFFNHWHISLVWNLILSPFSYVSPVTVRWLDGRRWGEEWVNHKGQASLFSYLHWNRSAHISDLLPGENSRLLPSSVSLTKNPGELRLERLVNRRPSSKCPLLFPFPASSIRELLPE